MVGLCRAQIRSGARCRLLPARINTLREEAAQSAGHRSIQAITRALLFPFVVLGQEIQPFDRLGRENVTIQAQHKRGGSSSDYDYRTSWGSYSKTVTSTKEIEVTIKQHRKEKQPLEFFFIIKRKVGPLRSTRRHARVARRRRHGDV
jgi:hypothetical protein